MICLQCDNCDETIDITAVMPLLSFHPDDRMHNVLPYLVEVRCPGCEHILGRNWAMVDVHYQWEWD